MGLSSHPLAERVREHSSDASDFPVVPAKSCDIRFRCLSCANGYGVTQSGRGAKHKIGISQRCHAQSRGGGRLFVNSKLTLVTQPSLISSRSIWTE